MSPADPLPSIDADIAKARALPGRLYSDPAVHARLLEVAFARSWQPLAPEAADVAPGHAAPFELLPGSVAEPLLAWRDAAGALRVFSNVCTHRGHLLLDEPAPAPRVRCRYHGRTFDPQGCVLAAPGFEKVAGFPSATDALPELRTAGWGQLMFTALPGAPAFAEAHGTALARLSAVGAPTGRYDAARSKDYEVEASWIAYVDNYLEGLHIPFVHGGLRGVLDLAAYQLELLPGAVLQVAKASPGEASFGGPKAQGGVAAYYLWLWPNLMLNLYPWGLSLNVVEPLGPELTRVRFRSYVHAPELLGSGAGAGLDAVELEDEQVVERVQRGLRSRLYERGRYSPTHERGVHAFHRQLVATLALPSPRGTLDDR